MESLKYRNFLLAGALLGAVQLALKYFTGNSEIVWDVRVENIVIAIAVAWANERYVQKKLGIILGWRGPGQRFIRAFFWSACVWALTFWLAVPEIFQSRGPLRFFANIGLVYLLAGAFFEICSLIKVKREASAPKEEQPTS